MLIRIAAACVALAAVAQAQQPAVRPLERIERLVAMAHLDAAVRYFNPIVATRASSWDSLFAAHVVRIADAPTRAEYGRLVAALMTDLHDDAPVTTSPQRALRYDGFPSNSGVTTPFYSLGWRGAGSGESHRVEMGEGVKVDVRLSEPGVDTADKASLPPAPTSSEWRARYPTAGNRILGAARVWSTIRHFFPYKSLMGGNWDDQFRAALPAVEGARDAGDYYRAIASFTAHINDTHVFLSGGASGMVVGNVPIGAMARFIENELVITRIASPSAAEAGLQVGDVVVSIDGETVAQRSARLTPLFSVSTPQSLRNRLQQSLLNGTTLAPARLVVRGATGGDRSLEVPRSPAFISLLAKHRTGSLVRILPGNIGYIDLDRLPGTMVDSAFRTLAGTKAIVLDDRGYPLGTMGMIAPRIGSRTESTTAALFRQLMVNSPDTTRTTVREFDQVYRPSPVVTRYEGRTVMLIDERAISQAEHTGLWFEAANRTTFVGSPTMGANGNVTGIVVPGGIYMSFTGMEVRHGDGSQLQRVGLQPQLAVSPTIAGVRAGRDEVLEAALKYLGATGEVPADTVNVPYVAAPVTAARPSVQANPYAVGPDLTVAHSGTSSERVASRTATADQFGVINRQVRADNYRGKRLRFSAWVKTRDAVGVGAGLWLRIDGDGRTLALDNMRSRALPGTKDWTRLSIVVDVPENAIGMMFGMLLYGPGEAWIDDATFEIVGDEVLVTAPYFPESARWQTIEQQRAMYAARPLTPENMGFEPRARTVP